MFLGDGSSAYRAKACEALLFSPLGLLKIDMCVKSSWSIDTITTRDLGIRIAMQGLRQTSLGLRADNDCPNS